MKYKIHPLADLIPSMTDEEYQALKSDIQNNGYRKECPIILYEDKILDGRHRYKACQELGIEPKYEEYKGTEPSSFVISLNLKRRNLTKGQLAALAVEFIPELEKEAEIRMKSGKSVNLTQKIGEGKHTGESAEEAAELFDTNRQYISDAKKIKKERPKLFEELKAGTKTMAEVKEAMGIHVGHNSGENEWYTPKKYIDAAREVMGEIDLDPASSDKANKVVCATEYYTKENDGLNKKWEGNVWMNPPYAQSLIEKFIDKMVKSFNEDSINQAIVLVNNATETGWFQKLLGVCSAVCLVKGRIKFIDMNGKPSGAPLQGQAILYLGENTSKFNKEFSNFGIILWKEEK